MSELTSFLHSLRALSFGGLIGAGLGALVFFQFQPYLATINPYLFIGTFAALGTGFQQSIHGVLAFVFKPIFQFLAFYEKLLELSALASQGKITEEKHDEIVNQLVEERFLKNIVPPKRLS